MKIVFAGGGTAGHINPALAIAGYIKSHDKNADILFVGNSDSMEQRLVTAAGYKFETVDVCGFSRSFSPSAIAHNVSAVYKAATATSKAKKILKRFKPDVCVGTGGYVSGPVVKAAAKLGIYTLIHEQNAYPGVTNKLLSKRVDVVMLAVAEAHKYIDSAKKIVTTGNPVRGEILNINKADARKKLGIDDKPLVLSFGGSLGARAVNEAVAPFVARSGKDRRYNHIHAYGRYGSFFPELVKENGVDISQCKNLDIREFINDMDVCLAAADLVICRAGAITLSELQATGKPSILIPSPNVAENHQYHNAMALVNSGAADIIEEKDLTPQKLMETADNILSSPKLLETYSKNAEKSAIKNSAEQIYRLILKGISTSTD